MSNRNTFRATTPPFLDYLKGVLRRYPDGGQILKELLQNADDAAATEVIFIHDERTYRRQTLWSEDLGRYQGPALFAFNNAVFTDEDWMGIQATGRSIKCQNPNKVGRFGIGFNSVYHITDLPCIFSAKHLAMFDPQKMAFEREGFIWSLDFEDDRLELLSLHDQFQPFKDVLEQVSDRRWEDMIGVERYFNGTLLRFPLRSEPSAITDNLYDSEKMSQLFGSFTADVHICLLFLRNVRSVTLLRIDSDGSVHQRLKVVASGPIASTAFSQRPAVEGLSHLRSITTFCPGKEETETNWVVTECRMAEGKVPELDLLAKRLGLHPEVALAFPIEEGRALTNGRLSCFLPLPNNEQNTTGLPLHVHASFGLTDNRRDMKWQEEDQRYDEVAVWNEVLLKEVLPCAYSLLILHAVELSRSSDHFPTSTVYRIWPDIGHMEHKKRWRTVALNTLKRLLHLDVLALAGNETEWIKPTESVFLPTDNVDPQIMRAVSDYLISAGVKLVSTPPHVSKAIQLATEMWGTLTRVSPEYIRHIIRRGNLANTSREARLSLLEYVLSDRMYSELEGLQLLPLSDGSFTVFSQQAMREVYIDSEQFPRVLLPCFESAFLLKPVRISILQHLMQIEQMELFRIYSLDAAIVELHSLSSLPEDWQKSCHGHVTWKIGNSLHPPTQWLREFWKFLNTYVKDLKNYVGMPLVPLEAVQEDTQAVELARLQENTTLMFGESPHVCLPEEVRAVLHRVGASVILSRDECLRHDNLENYISTPTPRNVVQLLLNLETSQVIQGISSAPDNEREGLKCFLSSLRSFMDDQCNLLCRLPLFQSSPHLGNHTGEYMSAKSLPAIDLKPFPAIPSHLLMPGAVLKCDTEVDKHLLTLLNTNLLESHQVARLLVSGIKRDLYKKEDVDKIMKWIIEHGNILFALEQTLSMDCEDVCFMEIHGRKMAKASDLFDPDNETFKALFEEDFFPPLAFRKERMLESLRHLGLKNKAEDVEPEDVFHIAMDIVSSHISPERSISKSEELIRLCNQTNVLSKFSVDQTERLLDIQWFPCDNTVSRNNLSAEITVFCRPNNVRDSSYSQLVDLVMPLTDKVHGQARERLGLMRRPPANKVFENLTVLRTVVSSIQDPNEDAHFKDRLHCIYRFLQAEMKLDSTIKSLIQQNKNTPLLWVNNDFSIPCNVVFGYPKGLDLSSYIQQVPEEFLQYKKLLTELGVKESLSDSEVEGVLNTIRHRVELRQPSHGTRSELEVVINILNWMCKEEKDVRDDLPVPVMTEGQGFKLLPKCSTVFCDITSDGLEELREEQGEIHVILEEIPKATAMSLRIPLLSTLILKPEFVGIEQCGQTEPITLRIKNILEEYDDENDLFKELIQNAEDAGATTCRFMLDYRRNEEPDRLIDPGMAPCQGPCLWAFNNEIFTDEDWKNITKVGARTKEQKWEKIGRFGLGFNVVYHITDIPSVLSGSTLLILDPNITHLRKHIQNKGIPGIKLDLRRECLFARFSGQFKCYERIFDWSRSEKFYNGTLIRLPFRTKGEAEVSEIRKKSYEGDSISAFHNHLSQSSETLLLFLNNIDEVSLQVLPENASSPPTNEHIQSPLKVSRNRVSSMDIPDDMGRMQISAQDSLALHNDKCCKIIDCHSAHIFEMTKENEDSLTVQHWLRYSCFGTQNVNEIMRTQEHQDLPIGGVAIPLIRDHTEGCWIPNCVNTAGQVYYFLPLSIGTGLPVHINGTFSVTSNRKTLWDTGPKHKWNQALLRGSVTTAYLTALLVLKEMSKEGELQKYQYFKFWPDLKQVSKAFCSLAIAFYSAVAQGLSGNTVELFSNGTDWCSIQNARFLHPNIEENDQVGRIAKHMFLNMKNEAFLTVPLPQWVRHNLIQTGFEKTIEDKTFHWLEFYKVVFTNLVDMDPVSRDTLVLHGIDMNDEAIDSLLRSHPCIPTPKGLQFIGKIVNPFGKAACLYEPHEGRILEGTKKDFLSQKRICRLTELGMLVDHLPFADMVERAKKIRETWMHDKRTANQRILCILDMADDLLKGNASPDWKSLGDVAFLPACQLFTANPGNNGAVILKKSTEIYSHESRYLVGMTKYFLDDDKLSSSHRAVLQKLGVTTNPPPHIVCHQLNELPEYSARVPETAGVSMLHHISYQCYKYFEQFLISCHESERSVVRQFRFVYIDGTFVTSDKVARKVKFDARPYLYKLPQAFSDFKHLWRCVGIKEQFIPEDYLMVLQNLKEKYESNPLSSSDLDTCLQIVTKGLYKDKENGQEDCLLPDENGVLRNSCQLYYNDSKWLPALEDVLLCHEYIPRSVAIHLKVQTTRNQTLQDHLVDDQIFDFEQKEELTVRLKNIISAYPSKKDILKELIQNADDAQATEIHFIWDNRKHNTVKTFGNSWNPLQGPALCVYNNKEFTETDLKGIQHIGEGGKRGKLGTTGKYGLGFNSVYHLTDCPSILTGDKSLCISDPNVNFVNNRRKTGAGYKITQRFKDSFRDVYNTYLPSFFQLESGTMFRLPIRTREMANCSGISEQEVTEADIMQLYNTLVEEPESLILFLRHIRKIQFHVVHQNQLKHRFAAEILSDENSKKRNALQTHLQSCQTSGGSISPFQTIYPMVIQSTGRDPSDWIVAERIGTENSKYGGRLPQVGVAARLGGQTPGRAFCSLALPGETGLPVHINGNFEVDSSRRGLWKQDGNSIKMEWNEHLKESVIAPLYADLLSYIQANNFCAQKQYTSLCVLGSEIHQLYLTFFPHVSSDVSQEWHKMIHELYISINKRGLELIPVLHSSIRINTQRTTKVFTLSWSTVCGTESTDEPHFNSKLTEGILAVLETIGMSLVPSSDGMADVCTSFKRAGVSVRSISPLTVREYLRRKQLNDPQKTECSLPLPIGHTLIRDQTKCKMLLDYCLGDINAINSSYIEGLPLLLTYDLHLREFQAVSPKFLSKFVLLFEGHEKSFAEYNTNCRHFEMLQKGHFLRELTISVSANYLKSVLQQLLQNCEIDHHSSRHVPNTQVFRWLEVFWRYVEDQICATGVNDEERNDVFKETKRLFSDAEIVPVLSPSQDNKMLLLPMNLLPSIVSDSTEDMYNILIKLGFMKLDASLFSKVMLQCHIKPEQLVVSDHSAVLEQLCGRDPAFDQIQDSDKDWLLRFLKPGLNASKTQKHYAAKLKSLPLFETTQGNRQSIDGYSHVIVFQTDLVGRFPNLHLVDADTVVLKYNHINLALSKSLNFEVVNDVEFFVRFIIPCLDKLSEAQVFSTIEMLLEIQNHSEYRKHKRQILSRFSQVHFIRDIFGNLQVASHFYDEEQTLFKSMLPQERFIPTPFWDSFPYGMSRLRLKDLLKNLGLRHDVSNKDCIQFALQIEKDIEETTSLETLKLRSTALLEWILSKKVNELDSDFLNQISIIKFVFSKQMSQVLCKYHQPFAGERETVAIKGSLIENDFRDKLLIWTSMPVLPLEHTASVHKNLQACGAVSQPPAKRIIENLRNICHVPCQERDLIRTRMEVLHYSYGFLQTANYDVSPLSDLPIVLVEEGTELVKPSNTVLYLQNSTEFRPYLHCLPPKLAIYREFFQNTGVAEKPSAKHYSNVLRDIHKDSSTKQTLNANQVVTVRRTVEKLFLLVEEDPKQTPHHPLYLPASDGRLYNSTTLHFNDTFYQPKRWKEAVETKLRLLEKLDACHLRNDPYEHQKLVRSLPQEVRPKLLSQVMSEDLLKSSVKACEYGEDCDFRNSFHTHLTSVSFMHGLMAVIRHQFKGKVSQDRAVHICEAIFSRIKIVCCQILETVLLLDGVPLEMSATETRVYVERTEEICTFYLRHDDLTPKVMNEINLSLTTEINAFLQNALSSDSLFILEQLLFCDTMDEVKRALENKGIFDSTDKEGEHGNLPKPGSMVPEEWFDSLDMDFINNFEKDEYVGFRRPSDENDVYYYAIIVARIDTPSNQQGTALSMYRVKIGPDEEIEASSLDIYKFIRTRKSPVHVENSFMDLGSSGNLPAEQQTPMKSQPTLEEIKRDIDRRLREVRNLPKQERQTADRRLFLQWHPEKNPDCVTLATEAFRYVKQRIQELEEGRVEPRGDCQRPGGNPESTRTAGGFQRAGGNQESAQQHRSYREFYHQWDQEASHHRRGRERFRQQHTSRDYDFWAFHGGERATTDQRDVEAQRWHRQALCDLEAAGNDLGTGHTEWCLFKVHQAVEKSLISAEYKRNGQLPTIRAMDNLAQRVACYSPQLASLPSIVHNLKQLGVDPKRTQYPNYHPKPYIPNEQFHVENEKQALDLASELLTKIDTYIS